MTADMTDIQVHSDYLSEDRLIYPHYHTLAEEGFEHLHACLSDWLAPIDTPQKELMDAARYSILSGGKRIRPLLLMAVSQHYGVDIALSAQVGGVIEMIHGYSLIHDDLPCMDNDDFRRGQKALHKHIGQGLALLTGDFLLTYAFDRLVHIDHLPDHLKINLLQTISKAAGHQGMVGGQYLDLTIHQHPHTRELLEWMHRKKTGALFSASMVCGALLGGCDHSVLVAWERISQELGLLFQLIDDLLDAQPRNITTRIPLGPSSYIAMQGFEETWETSLKIKEQLLTEIESLVGESPLFEEILSLICDRYKPAEDESESI